MEIADRFSPKRCFEEGFSALELIVVLSLSALLLGSFAPHSTGITGAFDRGSALKQFDADLRRARANAVAEGVRAVIKMRDARDGYQVGFDYPPYNDPIAIDELSFEGPLPNNITIFSDDIVFDPRGYSVDETGSLRTTVITLKHKGNAYSAGTLSPAGFLDY